MRFGYHSYLAILFPNVLHVVNVSLTWEETLGAKSRAIVEVQVQQVHQAFISVAEGNSPSIDDRECGPIPTRSLAIIGWEASLDASDLALPPIL
jgi:hypothetical protein